MGTCDNGVKKGQVLSALDFIILKNTTPPPAIETVNLRNPVARQHNAVYFLFYLFSLSAAEVQEVNIANHEYFHGYLVLLF